MKLCFVQFFNDKIHNYVLFAIIVHFNIQNLKNKQTFIQTEKAKSSHFDRTRGDKNQIFPTLVNETGFLMRIQKLLPALETLVITQEGSKFLILKGDLD